MVLLLVKLLEPKPEETVYDPACGSGGMLVETIAEVRSRGGDARTLRLFGQEVNLTTSSIARMNLYLHDIEDFKILRGDTLRNPLFRGTDSGLDKFDVVIANPPFSLKNWGAETWVGDTRAAFGVPPASSADFAWVQHMVASMKPDTGRVGVVMPHGVLFRGGAEKQIRQGLIKSNVLEAVIGLPPNMFYNTTIPACLLICRAVKSDERSGSVLLVDGAAQFRKLKTQNRLTLQGIRAIVDAYYNGTVSDDIGVRVRLVEHAEIKENDWDLNLGRYLGGVAAQDADVPAALAELTEAQRVLREAEARFVLRLQEAGYA